MRARFVSLLSICFVLFAGCTKEATPPAKEKAAAAEKAAPKLSDPADVATKFLAAFKAKDLAEIQKHSSVMMARQFAFMASNREESDYERYFDSWHDDVMRWDGKLKELRYRKEMMPYTEAVAYFVDAEKDEEKVVTVVMHHFNAKDWGFSTFETVKRDKFAGYAKEPPKE